MNAKILHILNSLNTGGAENLVLDAINKTPMYLVYMGKSNPARVELFNNSKAIDITYIHCDKGISSTAKFIKGLRGYLITNNITHVKCHNNVVAYWAKIASIGTCVKDIDLTIHGFNLDFNFLKNKFKIPIVHPDKAILKNINIFYVSKSALYFYRDKYGWGELLGNVALNTIDIDKFKNEVKADNYSLKCAKDDSELYNKIMLNTYRIGEYQGLNDKLLYGMVGNFNTPVRLQMMLCEAILIVKKNMGELPFKFVFAGGRIGSTPYLFDNCVEFCEKNNLDNDVIFLGQISDVPKLLARLDAYIYASSADAFGLTLLEANALRLPIICSDIPTFREVTENGRFATLVENTPHSFAEKIMKLQKSQISALSYPQCSSI